MVKITDHFAKYFIGADYEIDRPIHTVGGLKSFLEQIIANLPKDNNLEIDLVEIREGKISYSLKDGIIQ